MSIQAIICDFSGVILLANKPNQPDSLTRYYQEVSKKPGFQFRDYFLFNQTLIDFFKLNFNHLSFSLFSSSQLYSLTESQVFIGSIFDQIFTPDGLGFSKNDPDAYQAISQVLEIDPKHILFIDDEPDHVKAALHADLKGAHFYDTPKMITYLNSIA